MFKIINKKIISSYRWQLIVFLVTLFSIFFTFIYSNHFISQIESDWQKETKYKNDLIYKDFTKKLKVYESELIKYSRQLTEDKKLIQSIINGNQKKSFDYYYDNEADDRINLEIYNSRLELMLFNGREINPEISELSKSVNGKNFSIIKDIGYYTYLVYFSPLFTDTLIKSDVKNGLNSNGVIVVSELIDINPNIQNDLYQNIGITRNLYDKYGVMINLLKSADRSRNDEELESDDYYNSDIINSFNEKIGFLKIPVPDKNSYVDSVNKKFGTVYSFEYFILNLILVVTLLKIIYERFNKYIFYTSAIFLFIGSRFLWLDIQFPSLIFHEIGLKIFTPSHFASSFLLGIASSIGELFISFIIILLIVFIILKFAADLYKGNIKLHNKFLIIMALFSIVIIFISLFSYGYLIQTLIYDSDLKYFDKALIINTENIELLTMQFSIILITISFITIVIAASLIIAKAVLTLEIKQQFLKKNIVLLIFIFLIIINYILELTLDSGYLTLIKLNIRLLILACIGLFTFYFSKKLTIIGKYRYFNLLDISFLLVLCSVIIPVIMLTKITSQENKYLEVIARKVSEPIDDKIMFTIISTLEDMDENRNINSDILDKNKFPRLAFNLWSESKISSEKINSAIFVLDSSKKLISDFNINAEDLVSDSVINVALRNNDINNDIQIKDTLVEEENETLDENILSSESGNIYENPELKYYYGIKKVERKSVIDTIPSTILGYIIIAAKYDSKNYLVQSNLEIFKNFSRDNIENKIISSPIISEFTDGELTSASDKEVAKSFSKSISLFRESVRDKTDKSSWRYDDYQGEMYKSFYILSYSSKMSSSAKSEKIFIVSSKVNDFSIYSFYYFKFLIFITSIYLLVILIYLIFRLSVMIRMGDINRILRFGFREKLFASFLIVSVIPIIILALYTREFVQSKNNDFTVNQISSDLNIIDQYIRSKIYYLDSTKKDRKNNIINFSSLFGKNFTETHKNFNLFVQNKLVATTNEELYKSDLLDSRISGNAYYNVAILKKDFYIENQLLGNFKFVAGYKPLYDNFNNLIGIISSQSVFKQHQINEELTESLVYIFGTYFLTVVILVFLVNILSYRISNPIIKLLKATEQISKGNTEIEIATDNKDEIGELVQSFNKMTKELKRSRDELKKVERESAWRDIARQVAHEIKNPLTPMKLSIQHLYQSYKIGSNDFPDILKKTNQLICEQVETLNRIATEFSNFAKMPQRNYENIKLNELLTDAVHLMGREELINLKFDRITDDKDIVVTGDRDELRRAFINIIKNSLHAIEEKRYSDNNFNGIINIQTVRENGKIKIIFKDNGIGMDEETQTRLFEPYFSTKSKGMGLGLIITKKIIDDMKGNIYIESKYNQGTNVELSFKLQ